MILCSQAKLENDNKSVNVKRGIRTKCEMGWRPGVAPLGYMNRAFGGVKDIIPDPERADIIVEMFQKAGYERWSGRRIKDWLDKIGFTSRAGKPISVSQVLVILSTPFYYGRFQYPEAPDAPWYNGSHKPLVSKELYELVQQSRGVDKGVWGSKTFAFRGLLKCGRCGADITAQEKLKQLKGGEFARYVYYNCTRKRDPNCPEKYVNERFLRKELLAFIEANYKNMQFSDKLKAKAERHYNVTRSLFNHYGVKQNLDDAVVEYSRFVLTSGVESEMTTFSLGISTALQIKDSQLQFKI